MKANERRPDYIETVLTLFENEMNIFSHLLGVCVTLRSSADGTPAYTINIELERKAF